MSSSGFKTADLLGRFGPDFRSLVAPVAPLVFTGCASIQAVYLPTDGTGETFYWNKLKKKRPKRPSKGIVSSVLRVSL